jgi:SAM-dependent methyltransferase
MTTRTRPADPARLFRTLGDATRLRLLRLLGQEELNVAELCDILGLPQPTVSRHLALLREAGLLRDRREGPFAWYALAPEAEAPELHALLGAAAPLMAAADAAARRDRERLARVLERRRAAARRFFEAEGAHGTRQSRFGDLVPWRSAAGLLPRTGTVVDLGTGTGDLLPHLAPRAGRVVAVDFSEAMLKTARTRAEALDLDNVSFVKGELEAVPLKGGAADGVVASLVLHHAARPQEAVKEMARLLAPGGRAVVVDFLPHREEWLRDEEGDIWFGFPPDELRRWFQKAGFERILLEEGPPPASSGRRDRPGIDRRLHPIRLQWVEAVRTGAPAPAVARSPKGARNGSRKVQHR